MRKLSCFLLSLVLLTACGVKPSSLNPPASADTEDARIQNFPNVYPSPSTEPR